MIFISCRYAVGNGKKNSISEKTQNWAELNTGKKGDS